MKLQSPTLILVFFAIALGSFVAVTELRPGASKEEKGSQSLFSFEEEEVRSLIVETADQTLAFEKEVPSSSSSELESPKASSSESGDADSSDAADSANDTADSDSEAGDRDDDGTEGVDDKESDAEASNSEGAASETEETSSVEGDEEQGPEESSSDSDESSGADAGNSDSDSDPDAGESDAEQESPKEASADDDDSSERSNPEPIDSEWWMRSPDEAPADDPTVVFLVNLMASGVSDRVFDVPPENLDDFGFDSPLAEVEVTLENSESHRLILGNYDFNGNNIYAQRVSSSGDDNDANEEEDAPDGDTEADEETVAVFIVSTSFDAAVNRPLEEWKQSVSAAPDDEETEEPSDSPGSEGDEESGDS